MYAERNFSPADPSESEIYAFDFKRQAMADGETISSATWTCEVAEESEEDDADAASRVVGLATNAGTVTSQRIAGLLPGVTYVLRAVVATDQDNTKSLWAHVICLEPK